MARISGVNIPTNKKVNIALTYIFGIGRKFALDICKNASIDMSKRVSELNEDEVNKIRDTQSPLTLELLSFLKKDSSRGLCKYER